MSVYMMVHKNQQNFQRQLILEFLANDDNTFLEFVFWLNTVKYPQIHKKFKIIKTSL